MKRIMLTFAMLALLLSSATGTTYEKKPKVQKGACGRSCGRHGTCRESGCLCDPGWTGVGCKTKIHEPKAPKRQ